MATRPTEKFDSLFSPPGRDDAIPEVAEFARLARALRDRRFDDAARATRALRRMGFSILWKQRGDRP